MRVSMKKIIFVFCLFAAIAAEPQKKSPSNFSPGRTVTSPKGIAKRVRLLIIMPTGSTVGRILRIWIFLLITILYWR